MVNNKAMNFGRSVSISSDGSIVAVGAPGAIGGATGAQGPTGHVKIFKNVSGTWTQLETTSMVRGR